MQISSILGLLAPPRSCAPPITNRLILALLLAAAAPKPHHPPPARRATAAEHLHDTETQREARLAEAARRAALARAAAAREAALAAQRITAAAALRRTESETEEAAARLRTAEAAEHAARDALSLRRAAIAAILPAALRLALYPDETLIAAPVPPDQALAGLGVAQSITARLAQQVASLEAARAAAQTLRQAAAAEQAALDQARAREAVQQAALDRALGTAQQEQTRESAAAEAAAADAAKLAAQATTLRDAIAAMDEAEARAAARHAGPNPQPGPGLAPVGAALPVAGRVLKLFGAPEEDGKSTGVTLAATAGAVVTSPCSGHVAFAAPFRSYGRLMILACGDGYDFVLSGLGRFDTAVGRPVRAGEPIGRMAQTTPAPLYLELRHAGEPVDPLPFLNAHG